MLLAERRDVLRQFLSHKEVSQGLGMAGNPKYPDLQIQSRLHPQMPSTDRGDRGQHIDGFFSILCVWVLVCSLLASSAFHLSTLVLLSNNEPRPRNCETLLCVYRQYWKKAGKGTVSSSVADSQLLDILLEDYFFVGLSLSQLSSCFDCLIVLLRAPICCPVEPLWPLTHPSPQGFVPYILNGCRFMYGSHSSTRGLKQFE